MSISNQSDRVGPITLTAIPQAIATFPFQLTSDLLVLNMGTLAAPIDPATVLVLNSDYFVSGGSYDSNNNMQVGTVTLNGVGINPVVIGDQIVIMRAVPLTQLSSATTGPLTGVLVEQALDKLATIDQQQQEQASRSLRFENFETISGVLPLASRKSSYQAYDVNGNPVFFPTTPTGYFAFVVTAEQFGAVGDGVTDDSAAIQSALNSFGVKGGFVSVAKGRYFIGSSITVPVQCGLVGNLTSWIPVGAAVQFGDYLISDNLAGVLILKTTASIILKSAAGLSRLGIIRQGLGIPETNSSLFAGTAVISDGTLVDTNDTYIYGVCILGFALAISYTSSHRATFQNISGDNTAGIVLNNSFDVSRLQNIHFWPWVTQYAGVTIASQARSGVAYLFNGTQAGTYCDSLFCIFYATGIKLDGFLAAMTFNDCWVDNDLTNAGTLGYDIENTSGHSAAFGVFTNCIAYNCTTDFNLNATATDNINFQNCRAVGAITNGIKALCGNLSWSGGEITGAPTGILADGSFGGVTLYLSRTFINTCPTNAISAINGANVFLNEPIISSPNVGGWAVKTIASASPLVPTLIGDSFLVSGTTGFSAISNPWPGRNILLKFTGPLTITNGSGIILQGAQNYVTAAGDLLGFFYDGTNWIEQSRRTGGGINSSIAVATGSAVALVTNTSTNVTSLSLAAGSWDVSGTVNLNSPTAAINQGSAGISSTSATLPSDGSEVYCPGTAVTNAKSSMTMAVKRFTLTATTTIYLVTNVNINSGSPTAFGVLSASRIL